jgi:hypothetical protein
VPDLSIGEVDGERWIQSIISPMVESVRQL